MAPPDTFWSITGEAHAEIKVKGSRFIAVAMPVRTSAEAEAAIGRIRKAGYGATHHCSAYRIGPDGAEFRYNDDGEPRGTAGQPILRQIDGQGLTDTLIVVTRYFGGTRLGTGGLIRAYGDAAAAALQEGAAEEHVLRTPVRVRFDYADTSPAMHTVGQFDVEVRGATYGEGTVLDLAVRRSQADDFVAAFIDALGGRGAARLSPEKPA